MNNYDIRFNSPKNRITIKYHEFVYYRTLLKSVQELHDISMVERIDLVLDFGEVKTLYLGFHQLINFRQGLKLLRSKKKVKNIVIINARQDSFLNSACSSVPLIENDFFNSPFSCITLNNRTDADQWLNHSFS